MIVPSYVVVDTRDGRVFDRDQEGRPWFRYDTAKRWADDRNAAFKPEYANSLQVFALLALMPNGMPDITCV